MPRLSCWFVRSALLHLALGSVLGAFILAAKAGAADIALRGLIPVHFDILIIGWLTQLSMGVAYWIFPRILLGDRGRPIYAGAAFALLQSGLTLNLISGLRLWFPGTADLFSPALVLQCGAVLVFMLHLLPRIRPATVRFSDPPPS
jgi:hypothetical protein